MKFRQSAEGAFECDVVPGTPHCGIDSTHSRFRYHVAITYTSRSVLDSNGFLLDNLTFQAYFNTLGKLRVSCELVAANAVEYFVALLADNMRYVSDVSVCVFPFDGVCVEAVHSNPNATNEGHSQPGVLLRERFI
jgi:hypothetical protein